MFFLTNKIRSSHFYKINSVIQTVVKQNTSFSTRALLIMIIIIIFCKISPSLFLSVETGRVVACIIACSPTPQVS